MFKGVLTGILILIIFFESYKHSISKNFLQTTTNQKNWYFSETHYFYVFFTIFFLYKLIPWNNINFILVIFFIVSVIAFTHYTCNSCSHYSNILALLTAIMLAAISTKNIGIFIIVAELLSIIMFFILFFSNGFYTTNLSQGVFYFLVGNILTFLFGLLFLILVLCSYGTLNMDSVSFLSRIYQNNFIVLLFTMYLLLKLGQGPAVFFKFRFYRSTTLVNLMYYIFTYIILIWPLLLLMTLQFDAIITSHAVGVIFVVITLYILQSLFYFTGVVDFAVFSTWAFTWYMLVYVIV